MSPDPNRLDHPPFPPMEWEDSHWVGDLELAHLEPAGLTVNLDDPEHSRVPSLAQEKAFSFLVENEDRVTAAILSALKPCYEDMRPRYQDFLGERFESLMPEVKTPEDLRRLIDLRQIYVHAEAKDGLAYTGLLFGCTWDVEHGAGAMMHGDRVVEVSDADVSFAWAPNEADNAL